MQIATLNFGRKHYQNGQANAFRHALWNVLIAQKCMSGKKVLSKVLNWTKLIADWHEEAFFSNELPMKMDYHNNAVGRTIFCNNLSYSQEQFIQLLLQLTQKAVKIDKNTGIKKYKNQLVYITDDH
jgi:hypothetical protein